MQAFGEAGGPDWRDIMDMHLCPVTIPPELYKDDLAQINETMAAQGQAKPSAGVAAKDIMGNGIGAGDLAITSTRTCLVAEDAGMLRRLLSQAQ